MIKSELVDRLSNANPHLYQRDLQTIVNAILHEIARAMAEGDRVEIRGFGTFSVKIRTPRTARNPRTGASVQIGTKLMPYFRAAKDMHHRLNVNSVGKDQQSA